MPRVTHMCCPCCVTLDRQGKDGWWELTCAQYPLIWVLLEGNLRMSDSELFLGHQTEIGGVDLCEDQNVGKRWS